MSLIENNIIRNERIIRPEQISVLNNALEGTSSNDTSVEKNKLHRRRKDQLELSEESKRMNEIVTKTNDMIDQIEEVENNSDKIKVIKNRVKNGFYQTDGAISTVIDNFLDEAIFDVTI